MWPALVKRSNHGREGASARLFTRTKNIVLLICISLHISLNYLDIPVLSNKCSLVLSFKVRTIEFSEIQTELSNLAICLILLPNLPNSVKIKNPLNTSNFYFILECLKFVMRTFWTQFEVLVVKTEHFSKIWQICQIHFGKTKTYIMK